MNKKENKRVIKARRSFIMSVLSFVLCIAMLIGSTFAWFTDSVTSGKNRIIAGNLDIEMYYKNRTMNDWKNVTTADSTDPNFFVDKNGQEILWEPGVVSYATFEVRNVGNLALKYQFYLEYTQNYLNDHGLSEVVKAAIVKGTATYNDRSDVEGLIFADIDSFTMSGELKPNNTSVGTPSDYAKDTFTIVLYWAPNEDTKDNLYNVNNGQQVSDCTDDTNNYLWLDMDIKLTATQKDYESDSFGTDYDKNVVSTTYSSSSTSDMTIQGSGDLKSVTVPAAVSSKIFEEMDNEDASSNSLTLTPSVTKVNETEGTINLELDMVAEMTSTVNGQSSTTTNNISNLGGYVTYVYDIGANKDVTEVTHTKSDNTTGNVVESDTLDTGADVGYGVYSYDSTTGLLTIKVSSLSPFTVTYENGIALVDGNVVKTVDEFKSVVGQASTIKLLADIDLTGTGSSDGITLLKDGCVFDYNGNTLKGTVFTGDISNGSPLVNVTFKDTKLSDTKYSSDAQFYTTEDGALYQFANLGQWQAKVTVESGYYHAVGHIINSQLQSCNSDDIAIEINGGKFESESGDQLGAYAFNAVMGKIIINNGTFINKGWEYEGNTYGGMFDIDSGSSHIPTIITINGGNFTCDTSMFYFDSDTPSSAREVYITGGTFTVNNSDGILVENYTANGNKGDKIIITGGTFNRDPSDYVDNNIYKVTANTSANTWTVTKK